MSLPNWLIIIPAWLSFAASVASVAGFFISLAVLAQTREIKRTFVLRARLPELSADLKAISSELVKSLENTVADSQGSDTPILRLRSVLISLMPKVGGSQLKMTRDLLKMCGGIHNKLFFWQSERRTAVSVRSSHLDLKRVSTSVRLFLSGHLLSGSKRLGKSRS
jgi:hypothetical protein